jgi:hypothetical protein
MSVGGMLLGAVIGAVVALFASGPVGLFARFGYVLPAVFGVAGGVVVRRLPGRRFIGPAAGLVALAAAAVVAIVVGYFVWYVVTTRHGWF